MQRCICQPDDRQTLRIRPLRTDLAGRSSLGSSQPGTRAPSRSGFVITVLLSAAPGSSPFRRIPETNRQLTTWCRRMQAVCKMEVKFLPPRHFHRRMRSKTRAVPMHRPHIFCAAWVTSSRFCKTPSGSSQPVHGSRCPAAQGGSGRRCLRRRSGQVRPHPPARPTPSRTRCPHPGRCSGQRASTCAQV